MITNSAARRIFRPSDQDRYRRVAVSPFRRVAVSPIRAIAVPPRPLHSLGLEQTV
jgi:hypothetical protein